MLKSGRKNRDMEGIINILSEDLGEVLAESLAVRYLCGMNDSGTKDSIAVAAEGLREGLQMFMTSGEVSVLIRRIQVEWEGELPKERHNGFPANLEE
jgi:hypothetical protein